MNYWAVALLAYVFIGMSGYYWTWSEDRPLSEQYAAAIIWPLLFSALLYGKIAKWLAR